MSNHRSLRPGKPNLRSFFAGSGHDQSSGHGLVVKGGHRSNFDNRVMMYVIR